MRVAGIVAGVVIIGAGLWWWRSVYAPKALVWYQEEGYRWAEVQGSGVGVGFEAIAPRRSGITFANRLSDDALLRNRHYANGSGVATGDVDGDGWPDVYLAGLEGRNALYRNRGRWRFEDITEQAGVGLEDRFSTGAVFADLEGDGDLDLLVTAMDGPNAVLQNDGTGKFTDITEASGLAVHGGTTSIAVADVDADGDLDVYIGAYKKHTAKDVLSPDVRGFENTVVENNGTYRIHSDFDEHYRLRMDGNLLMRFEYGEPDRFFLNDGTGHFEELDFTSGRFLNEAGMPLQETPTDWALTVRFQDVNGDGTPDLYVCNDFESPDHFWLNDGTGTFRLIDPLALRKTSNATMAVDFSDINRDGYLDFLLADMLSPDPTRRRWQKGLQAPEVTEIGEIDNRPQVMHNTLFMNRGDGTYAEQAYMAGIAASEWTWAVQFLDVDLDGYEDVLITNGHAYDAMDADTQGRIARLPITDDWRNVLLLYPDLDLPNMAFRNEGGQRFVAISDGWGIGKTEDVSHGLATADFDNDGDLDVIVNRLNQPATLFENQAKAARIGVRLRGLSPNTQAIGAKITVTGGPVIQTKHAVSGGQYLSGSAPFVTFAGFDQEAAFTIDVIWPSGRTSHIADVFSNRIYEIDEPGVRQQETVAKPDDGFRAGRLFQEVAFDHQHVEAAFDDFGPQPLLPKRVTQRGPAVAWGDVDADGDPDLLISSGRGGALGYYRNRRGQLEKHNDPILTDTAPLDQVALAILPNKTGAQVLVGVANDESPRPLASYIEAYRVNQNGRAVKTGEIEISESSIGDLVVADFNQDGEPDVFVTGHHLPLRYPMPASSHVLMGENETWIVDAVRSQPFTDLGIATAAAAGDLDGDSDSDLVVATEWGPVRAYRNDGTGQFDEMTRSWGLAEQTGLWQDVALVDVNNDGTLDIVATNWGWNSRYGQPAYPIHLYHGDLDGNRRYDVVEAMYVAEKGAYQAERGLDALWQGIPALRGHIRSFRAFAEMPIGAILGPMVEGASPLEANTLTSTVFVNTDNGFVRQPLPAEAQHTPGMGITAADFNQDGNQDLVLSQNFFAVRPDDTRLDAGRSLFLQGDGTGHFTAIPGHQSGLLVYGESRGIAHADFDGDGWLDIVITQNGAATKLYRNAGSGGL